MYPDPSPEIRRAIEVAAQAAISVAVEALGGNPAFSTEHPVGESSAATDAGDRADQDVTASDGPGPSEPSPRQGRGAGRKRRQSISLGEALALIELRESGQYKWSEILSMFHLPISESTARGIYKNRAQFKRRAAADENLSWTRHRRSYFEQVSSKLWDGY